MEFRRIFWRPAAAVVCILWLAGCSKPPAELLVGTWEAEATKKLEAVGGSVRMEFGADGTTSVTSSAFGQRRVESGRWELVRSSKRELVIKRTLDKDGTEHTAELTLVFQGDDTLQIMMGGKPSMTLKRVRASS